MGMGKNTEGKLRSDLFAGAVHRKHSTRYASLTATMGPHP